MSVADRGMGLGLQALRKLASFELIDRIGLRKLCGERRLPGDEERLPWRDAGRPHLRPGRAARQARPRRASRAAATRSTSRPTTSSRCCWRSCASSRPSELRPAALSADEACAASAELLAQGAELGLATLGVPEELGGTAAERSAVTTVLVDRGARPRRHGPRGLAARPQLGRNRARTLGQLRPAGHLPAGLHRRRRARAPRSRSSSRSRCSTRSICRRPRASTARATSSTASSRSSSAAADAEVLLVAAALEGHGPALFLVESGARRA